MPAYDWDEWKGDRLHSGIDATTPAIRPMVGVGRDLISGFEVIANGLRELEKLDGVEREDASLFQQDVAPP